MSLQELQEIYLFMEDYNSSLSQARKLLANNGHDDANELANELAFIYKQPRFESEEHRVAPKDVDLPILALLYIGGFSIEEIRDIYHRYVNSKALYSDNYFSKWGNKVLDGIRQNNWRGIGTLPFKVPYIRQEYEKLDQKLTDHYVSPSMSEQQRNAIDLSQAADPDADMVYEDEDIVVYRSDSMDKCIHYSKNSNLCIGYPRESNYYWRYRTGAQREDKLGMTTYFVFWKNPDGSINPDERIIVDALGDENGSANEYSYNTVVPNNDEDISKESLLDNYPDLEDPFRKGVFQFIPYGENEKRVTEIKDNNYSILDDTLKTYADYDIYVQLGKKVLDGEWDQLKLPISIKKLLVKKYMGAGNMVSKEVFKKYGNKNDITWYEDILSRNQDAALAYYIDRDGKVQNEAIKAYYDLEKDRVDELKEQYKHSQYINLSYQNLYVLPDFSDRDDIISFNCADNKLRTLKGSPKRVELDFDCNYNFINTLEGGPEYVGGMFSCSSNALANLKGFPKTVKGSINISYNRDLKNLEGCPKIVWGLNASDCNLHTLEGGPENVGNNFSCASNYTLTNIQGAPKRVGESFDCSNCGITSLEGGPKKVGYSYDCSYNKLKSYEGTPEEIGGFFSGYGNTEANTDRENKPLESSNRAELWSLKFKKKIREMMKSFPDPRVKTESFTFKKFFERKTYLHQIDESYAKPLTTNNIGAVISGMAAVERRNFSSYYAAGEGSLIHDSDLDGFMGYGLFDEQGRIVGYVYGYTMGADGEYYQVNSINPNDINFHDKEFRQAIEEEGFEQVCNPDNTLYVSNMAINKENRIGLKKMLLPFLSDAKSSGHEYLVFDGLSDTLKLLRNEKRLGANSLKIMADVPEGERSLVVMKFV